MWMGQEVCISPNCVHCKLILVLYLFPDLASQEAKMVGSVIFYINKHHYDKIMSLEKHLCTFSHHLRSLVDKLTSCALVFLCQLRDIKCYS